MEIKRAGSQPSQKAAAEHFTGTLRIDPLFQAPIDAAAPAIAAPHEYGVEARGLSLLLAYVLEAIQSEYRIPGHNSRYVTKR